MYRYILFSSFLFALCVLIPLQDALAQQSANRKIGAAEIAKMTDNNTFWELGKLNRIYFKPDNSLVQQINDGWNGLPAGTIFKGTWTIKNDTLCWAYSADTASQFKVSSSEVCFDVYTEEPAKTFMTTHVENTSLKPVGSGPNGPTIFRLNQWHHDDYVIDPAYAPQVVEALETMKAYRFRYGGAIPGGTIKREEMTPAMQDYYDMMVDHIFFVVGDYMFFDDTGHYYWVQAPDILAAKGNVDEMLKKVQIGRWLVKDNIHCWFINSNIRSCEYILPRGKGLTRDYEGILGFHHSSFSRVHGEGAVGHMLGEDSESPELFEKLQEMHKGK